MEDIFRWKKRQKRETSHILKLQELKMNSSRMQKSIKETSPTMFRLFQIWNINNSSSYHLVNYYENNDFYNSHYDVCMMSTLIWFYRKPKAYTGGNFTFSHLDVELESNHNRLVLFPGYYPHKVDPILMNNKKSKMGGFGRYSIAGFYLPLKDRNATSADSFLGFQALERHKKNLIKKD